MPLSSFDFIKNENNELCFDSNVFLKESFSIDEFLRNHRNKATLEILRNDLGTYLKTLRLSMIELINEDYEDFVNLSKDLVGLNTGIEVLQGPLEQVRSEIVVVKDSLESTIVGLRNCLEQDRLVKEKKQSLFHLSQVILSLNKLNCLLKNEEMTSRSIGIDLIERASTEYTMLQFSSSKSKLIMSRAQIENSESLGNILMDLLNNTFLECICDRNTAQIRRCLRIFGNLDKVMDAEALIRKEVIAPYLYDLVNETSLSKEPGGLSGIYQKVLEFIDIQLAPLLGLKDDGTVQFNFLLNALWVELARRIEVHMGSVFSVGDPTVFHTRFITTTVFIEALRQRCNSPTSAAVLDAHPQTIHFLHKWNLLVYYKIRFQEIAGQFECSLSEGAVATNDQNIYGLKIPAIAVMCLQRCWDNEVFLPELAHVFWRLSLQILARYCIWCKEETSRDYKSEERKPDVNRANQLCFFISLHKDTVQLNSEAVEILKKMRKRLPGCEETNARVNASLEESTQQLGSVLSLISQSIVERLVRESVLPLAYVKDIPRLFRRTNRETPTKPCDYVQNILQPLTLFYNSNKNLVSSEVLETWVIAVFSEISRQFYSSVSEVLENAHKTEESLRKLKKAKDKYSTSGDNRGSSDDDKIRQQLVVDVQAYCSGTQALGVQPDKIPLLNELVQLVESAREKSERQ